MKPYDLIKEQRYKWNSNQGANGCVVNDKHETPQGLGREKSATVTATGKCSLYLPSSSTSLQILLTNSTC